MSDLWILFFVVWAIAEVIGLLRKKELRQRMKTAAIWSTIITAIAAVGQMDPETNSIPQLAIAIALIGVIAIALFYSRIWISNMMRKKTA